MNYRLKPICAYHQEFPTLSYQLQRLYFLIILKKKKTTSSHYCFVYWGEACLCGNLVALVLSFLAILILSLWLGPKSRRC